MLESIKHINVVIKDLDRSLDFYNGKLGAHCSHGPFMAIGAQMAVAFGIKNTDTEIPNGADTAAFLRWTDADEDTVIDLGWWHRPRSEGEAYHKPNNVGHQLLNLKVHDIDSVYEDLSAKGIKFNSKPVTVNISEEVRFACFDDPDGVGLRLVEQTSEGGLPGFERIFGVSTVVRDLDKSLPVYTKMYGMDVVRGPFELEGPEIASAFRVDGSEAKLRGVWLQPGGSDNGTLMELIQWITPATSGEPYPLTTPEGGSFCNHVGIPRVAFIVKGIYDIHKEFVDRGVKFVSPPQVTDIGPDVAYCCFTDPDGTILQLYENVLGDEKTFHEVKARAQA